MLLSTAYLPPVDYMSVLKNGGSVGLEVCEHFVRQSFRNRALILSPNGVLPLSIPVVKNTGDRQLIRDIRISYDFKWQRIHWLSLESCYRRSAWFEFFEDQLRPFYFGHRFEFLIDYNQEWLAALCCMLGTGDKAVEPSSEYFVKLPEGIRDYRSSIHPKLPPLVVPVPYRQVFAPPGRFYAGLSVIDLLMNEGRVSSTILDQTWQSLTGNLY